MFGALFSSAFFFNGCFEGDHRFFKAFVCTLLVGLYFQIHSLSVAQGEKAEPVGRCERIEVM
jgi:hypothetical protein